MHDWERGYAEKTANEVLKMIERLCTPYGDVLDAVLFDDILTKTRGLVVDGALLKTGKLLRDSKMPNIVLILRDPAHVIRPSCRDPLHDADQFKG